MAKKTIPKGTGTTGGVWRPFVVLVKGAGLPYIAILVTFITSLVFSQVQLILPQATARVAAGDVSSGAIFTMVAILILQGLLLTAREGTRAISQAKVSFRFRKFMVHKTMDLPVGYYDKNRADLLISRVTTDTTMLSTFFGSSIPYLPSQIYSFIATFVILFSYNWRLLAMEAVMLPVVLLVTALSGRIRYTWNNRIQGGVAALSGYLSGILVNTPLVKVFGKEQAEEKRGEGQINSLFGIRKRYSLFVGLVNFLSSFESLLQSLLVIIGGAWLVNAGHITLEQWIAFYLYANTLIGSVTQTLQVWEAIKEGQGAARRISELAVAEDENRGGREKFPAKAERLSFENVTFRYDREITLKDISFTIPAGKTTALVGPSGAGKSTVFALLERFYTPESGTIRMGGRDVREYDVIDWRRSIGYVPQDCAMFSGTIRDNITYGLEQTVSEERLIQAAKDANIYDYIQSLERGFDTPVGERGGKLSGGQRQRVAIARALLKDPKILLLDEATSSLDPEAKDLVEQAMNRLKAGRTTVVVAHDLSSVRDADQIVVLDGGRVSGTGSHQTLLKSNPVYAKLHEMQNAGAAPSAV